jgi:hypothetical protein
LVTSGSCEHVANCQALTISVRIGGSVSFLSDSLDTRFAAVIGTTLGRLNMWCQFADGVRPQVIFTQRYVLIPIFFIHRLAYVEYLSRFGPSRRRSGRKSGWL